MILNMNQSFFSSKQAVVVHLLTNGVQPHVPTNVSHAISAPIIVLVVNRDIMAKTVLGYVQKTA